jgi:hypothetical protein
MNNRNVPLILILRKVFYAGNTNNRPIRGIFSVGQDPQIFLIAAESMQPYPVSRKTWDPRILLKLQWHDSPYPQILLSKWNVKFSLHGKA